MSSIKNIYERNIGFLEELEKKLVEIAKEFTSKVEFEGKEAALNYLNEALSNFGEEFEIPAFLRQGK